MTKEDFEALVSAKVDAGTSFVGAVYQTLDELVAGEDLSVWACHKGCSYCCYQMVHITRLEAGEIVRYLNTLQRKNRKTIMQRAQKRFEPYVRWFNRMGGNSNPKLTDDRWVRRHWNGKPCPFLNDLGGCSIYEVRPIDCRATYSKVVCGTAEYNSSHSAHLPYPYQFWANQILIDHAKKKRKFLEVLVLPIHHWLWVLGKKINK